MVPLVKDSPVRLKGLPGLAPSGDHNTPGGPLVPVVAAGHTPDGCTSVPTENAAGAGQYVGAVIVPVSARVRNEVRDQYAVLASTVNALGDENDTPVKVTVLATSGWDAVAKTHTAWVPRHVKGCRHCAALAARHCRLDAAGTLTALSQARVAGL